MTFRVAVWNAEWASPRSVKGRRIAETLCQLDAGVIVLTEGSADLLPSHGHVVTAGPDWGYRVDEPGRRKVLLWSRNEWADVDSVGSPALPPGRWIAGTTETPLGPIWVRGVCIPWRDAHVKTGRRDRERWAEHLDYLRAMGEILDGGSTLPAVVAGDFNQRIPRRQQPVEIAEVLEQSLCEFQIVTAGEIDGHRLIDHVAVRGLHATATPVVIDRNVDGIDVSDHDGVIVELERA